MKIKICLPVMGCILAANIISGCSPNPVTGKKELVFMSQEKETALGASSHPSVVASMGLYNDPKLQQIFAQRGQEMAKISDRAGINYQFFIVDSPVVNAFAVPGGYVYFTRGILAHFNNEAEFAGVLGHEIGHIAARHSARQQTGQILSQVGMMAGIAVSPTIRGLADQLQQSVGLLMLSYSRAHETEADEVGVKYSSKIGYDAHQMAGFFGTLKSLSAGAGQSIPTFQSTHPDPGDRKTKVAQLATKYQTEHPGKYEIGRDSYLKKIDGIVYGEDPKQGFIEKGVFYHPELKLQFPVPANWQTENTPAQFQMAAKDGKSMMIFTMAEGKTLDEAAQGVLKTLSLKASESNKVTINGFPALAMVSTQVQEGQQQTAENTMQVATWLIQYGGNIYALHGVSTATNFNANLNQFKSVANGFRSVSDASILSRQPERIRIKTIQKSGTLKDVLKDFNQPDARLTELSILNGMELTTRVEKGMLIKTIGK